MFHFFRVYGNRWASPATVGLHTPVNVLELSVTVGMFFALASFPVRLQRIAQLMQHPRNLGATDLIALLLQLGRQIGQTLARPTQRRLWITSFARLNQCFQNTRDFRLFLFQCFAAGSRFSLTPWPDRSSFSKFPDAIADRAIRHSRRCDNCGNASASKRNRFGRRPTPPPTFIEVFDQRRVLFSYPMNNSCIQHPESIAESGRSQQYQFGNLFTDDT